MKPNRQDDLVSMTAIITGAVVSVAVTIGSMILSGGDESADFVWEVEAAGWVPLVEAEIAPGVQLSQLASEGIGALEWRAIGTYKSIDAMTATYPTHDMIDRTLADLEALALDHPDNGFVQGLYLKALRVSEYYAIEAGDVTRAEGLQDRFGLFAPLAMRHEQAGLESIRFAMQRLERSCEHAADERNRLVSIMNRFPDSGDVAAQFVRGLEATWSCDSA